MLIGMTQTVLERGDAEGQRSQAGFMEEGRLNWGGRGRRYQVRMSERPRDGAEINLTGSKESWVQTG